VSTFGEGGQGPHVNPCYNPLTFIYEVCGARYTQRFRGLGPTSPGCVERVGIEPTSRHPISNSATELPPLRQLPGDQSEFGHAAGEQPIHVWFPRWLATCP
jgi:hypothetical protein